MSQSTMTRTLLLYALIVITSFAITSNVHCKEVVLELEGVNFFTVKEVESEKRQIIVSGLAMHSMLAVDSVTTAYHKDYVHLYVKLTEAKEGLRGDFLFPVIIPDNVTKIYFGDQKKLIWKKGQK